MSIFERYSINQDKNKIDPIEGKERKLEKTKVDQQYTENNVESETVNRENLNKEIIENAQRYSERELTFDEKKYIQNADIKEVSQEEINNKRQEHAQNKEQLRKEWEEKNDKE